MRKNEGPSPPRTHYQWLLLLVLSGLLIFLLQALHLPAAILLGAMIAAVGLSARGGRLQVHRWLFAGAQGVIGCMIARTMAPEIFQEMLRQWPLLLMSAAGVIGVSSALGWLMMRLEGLPGTTAIWGLSPGAATAVVLLADAYGADTRLVALMQYLRIAVVAVVASLVARIWVTPGEHVQATVVWFPAILPAHFAGTLSLVVLGAGVAGLLRIPAGALLLPLALSVALQNTELLIIELPPWLLGLSYVLIGWSIGLRFTRPVLKHCLRVLPHVFLAILLLIALCAGLAAILIWVAGIDPLTAYLATSPGGLDAIAIIAASSQADMPFVVAMQTARFVMIIVLGPVIAICIGRWMTGKAD